MKVNHKKRSIYLQDELRNTWPFGKMKRYDTAKVSIYFLNTKFFKLFINGLINFFINKFVIIFNNCYCASGVIVILNFCIGSNNSIL